jgi:hypothetical protein
MRKTVLSFPRPPPPPFLQHRIGLRFFLRKKKFLDVYIYPRIAAELVPLRPFLSVQSWMRLGWKANKLQTHFLDRNGMC